MVGSSVLVGSSRISSGAWGKQEPEAGPPSVSFRRTARTSGRSRSMSKRSARVGSSAPLRQAAQPAQEANELPAGHVFVEPQLAREVGDCLRAATPSSSSRGRRSRRGRPWAAGSPEASARRSICPTVGAQQAEDLAGRHGQAEIVQGAMSSRNPWSGVRCAKAYAVSPLSVIAKLTLRSSANRHAARYDSR